MGATGQRDSFSIRHWQLVGQGHLCRGPAIKHVGFCPGPEPHRCDVAALRCLSRVRTPTRWTSLVVTLVVDRHSHMIQVPGAEEDPALPVPIGVDGVLGKTALQVEGALE